MSVAQTHDYVALEAPALDSGVSAAYPASAHSRAAGRVTPPRPSRREDGAGRVSTETLRLKLIQRPDVFLFREPYHIIKRVFDLSVCLLLLPVVLIVIGICAVLVWVDDPGPIFFTQWRTGKGGRRFKMYKFRTMVTNAEELKHKYAHLNELTWPDFKITDDPRVTRVGRILRKTSLDELPQILNVLKGDMSLVGPRPTSFPVSTYALWHTERLEVLPGITGLWQLNGRSELDFDERLRLDIEYIQRRSLWLDIRIMIQTVTVFFSQRGAY